MVIGTIKSNQCTVETLSRAHNENLAVLLSACACLFPATVLCRTRVLPFVLPADILWTVQQHIMCVFLMRVRRTARVLPTPLVPQLFLLVSVNEDAVIENAFPRTA